MAPDSLNGRDDVLVLICSVQLNVFREVSAQLKNLGLSYLTVDEYVFAKRQDEILKCVELLDDESAETYTEIIECRLFGRLPTEKFISGEPYFILPEFHKLYEKEVFVDCGACVGDTIEQYLFLHGGTFGKIFAFEPDVVNYDAMKFRVERLNKEWALTADKIQLVNAGVGRTTTEGVIQNHDGLGTHIFEDTNLSGDAIKIYALDDFFPNQRIHFLKADIESFELDMLRGAEKIIRRDLPKIAVCIYHNASDIYQILLWLNGLNLGYNFAVRHHGTLFSETVLYAWK